jgi:transmembrane sensor
MQKDFRTLLLRWQSNEATEEEISELNELLKSDVYQKQMTMLLSDPSVSQAYDDEITDDRKRILLAKVSKQMQRAGHPRIRPLIYRPRIVSAAAAIVVLVALTYFWRSNSQNAASPLELSSVQVIDKRFVKLPDGTSVTLNKGSTITYNSETFGKANREVSLTGEAYFDVTHMPDKPFIVKTAQVSTTVLGTAFNVSAYSNKPVVVTVVRGKVKVGSDTKVLETLLPDQELIIEPSTLAYKKANVQSEEKVEWMANYLVLDNVTMREAAQMISKRYGTQILLGDSSLSACRISIFFVKNESLVRVLETVSLAKGGDYTIQKNIATIHGHCE